MEKKAGNKGSYYICKKTYTIDLKYKIKMKIEKEDIW